jgi:hypothetical protein
VVASEQATFVFVQELGPDVSEMVALCLLRVVGVDVLKRLLDTRGAIGAQMAQYLGFVAYTVPSSQFHAEQASIRSKIDVYSDAQLRSARESRCTLASSVLSSTGAGRLQGSHEPIGPLSPPLLTRAVEPVGFHCSLERSLADRNLKPSIQDVPDSQDYQMENAKVRNGSRKKDLASQFSHHDGPITSLMLCNIPCRVTQESLGEAIDELGFKDTYDFLYLPTASRSAKTTGSNLGYGFINFVDPCYPGPFKAAFTAYTFPGTSSQKVLGVKVAHVQGLAANMRNFGQANATRAPITQSHQTTDKPWGVEWEMSL